RRCAEAKVGDVQRTVGTEGHGSRKHESRGDRCETPVVVYAHYHARARGIRTRETGRRIRFEDVHLPLRIERDTSYRRQAGGEYLDLPARRDLVDVLCPWSDRKCAQVSDVKVAVIC